MNFSLCLPQFYATYYKLLYFINYVEEIIVQRLLLITKNGL
jgi:hypothetical protein